MKNKMMLLVTALLFLLGTTACSNNNQAMSSVQSNHNSTQNNQNTNELTEIIKGEIQKKSNLEVKNLRTVSSHAIDQGMLLMFLFDSKDEVYEGIVQVEKQNPNDPWKILYSSYGKTDIKSPFTVHQASGTITTKDPQQRKSYIIVGGVINDKNIKDLKLSFNDGTIAIVKLDMNTNTYSYARTDKTVSIKEILALDDQENTIYIYPPYPPTKK